MIIFENDDIIIANKLPSIPSVPDQSLDQSLLSILSKKRSKELFPLNRLDRPTSGIVLFAKSRKAAATYSKFISTSLMEKHYTALVQNKPKLEKDQLVHYIKKKGNMKKSLIQNKPGEGFKKAKLSYKTIGATSHYQILEIKLHTGRFHQIRAQLAHIGCPIKGDVKYGARRKNNDRSIHLHAHKLKMTLAGEKEPRIFVAPFPEDALWKVVQTIIG